MKQKKWLSYTIDAALLLLIGLFGYVQVSMMVTKDQNFGVPMAFGSSFLYVATESMDNPEMNGGLGKGSGIVIQKVEPSSLTVSTSYVDENGRTQYNFDGDVVTFFLQSSNGRGYPDTHRLIEKNYDEETGKYTFRTLGDNRKDNPTMSTEVWSEDLLIGKVVAHSQWFGKILTLISPEAAASAGTTAWLLPVAILIPLLIIAIMSVVDVFKAAKQKRKEEEAEMEAAMIAAGIDREDEEAVELFRAKEEFKLEYRAKLAEEVDRAKKEALKELKKAKKGGQ